MKDKLVSMHLEDRIEGINIIYLEELKKVISSRVKFSAFIVIDYFKKDNSIICEIREEDENSCDLLGVGVSRCHPEDDFELSLGMFLAEARARQDLYKNQEQSVLYREKK